VGRAGLPVLFSRIAAAVMNRRAKLLMIDWFLKKSGKQRNQRMGAKRKHANNNH
jgi:hypothetical protein